MKWMSITFLLMSWALWLSAQVGGLTPLSGWAFVLGYWGLGVCLLLANDLSGTLRTAVILFGMGYLLKALGEFSWFTTFPDGDSGGYALLPSFPYYASTILFVIAVLLLYQRGKKILQFPPRAVWFSLIGAVLLVLISSRVGFGADIHRLGFITDTIDTTLSTFAALVLVCIASFTFGGTWSAWAAPLAVAFGFLMLGNLYFSLTVHSYAYGSLADWFWMIEITIIYIFLAQYGDRVAQQKLES